MKQRERCIVREQTGRKDYENSRKSMQLYLNSLTGRGDGGIATSIESRRDGRCRAAQGPERLGQAALVRWNRYDVYNTAVGTRETTGDMQTSNQVNQHIEMPQIQHTDRVADESVVSQRQISSRTTETKAPERQWDDRSGDSRIEIPTLTKDQKTLHIASKKETVADFSANSNMSITSRVSQTTLSDFSKSLEEPSPTEKEEAIDDQTRSIDSHEIQCEK